ncbi:MAG TPA: type II toxin-antitoxin system VapC family toxin [Pirellulales bacterium]|jgi:predicted nucleic acid-binding protein|nr:type II toxin-antitoxin system VapC family toxin [Pirellulales bacterium]
MPGKPTIYLDTSIISAYWHESADVLASSRRLLTRQWWDEERRYFKVFTSSITEDELAAGDFPRQQDCLKMIRKLPYLPIDGRVASLAETLLAKQLVPASKPRDALQMAIATVFEIDYLLTWNYAHLANPVVQQRLAALCDKLELRVPSMVSPESIPKVALSQIIRRKPK